MAVTKVVNLRFDSFDVYIGRKGRGYDGYFGNPFRPTNMLKRGSSLGAYKSYFYNRINTDPEFKQRVHELKGKVLGCFCKPGPCHGDIICEYLNSLK